MWCGWWLFAVAVVDKSGINNIMQRHIHTVFFFILFSLNKNFNKVVIGVVVSGTGFDNSEGI